MKYKKLTRDEALRLRTALRTIREPLEALEIEWQYHSLQQQKVENAVDALLRSQGLEVHYDPESGQPDGVNYVGKLRISWFLNWNGDDPHLRFDGRAEWDLTGVDIHNVEEVLKWLKEESKDGMV